MNQALCHQLEPDTAEIQRVTIRSGQFARAGWIAGRWWRGDLKCDRCGAAFPSGLGALGDRGRYVYDFELLHSICPPRP